MTRPITLFTGQWADLPFEEVCRLASGWGYDGLEIACWGDHLDVWQAVEDDAYLADQAGGARQVRPEGVDDLQPPHGSGRLRRPDRRAAPRASCPSRIWGDGDAEGVRQRAAEEMKMTARAARRLGVDTVVGFTGSSIWKYVAMFPPATQAMVDAGYQDFADRWNPILDVFDAGGRALRPRGAPLGDRLRLLDDGADARGGRPPRGVRSELGPVALRLAGPRPSVASCGTSATGSTTWTARTRSSRSATAATAGLAHTSPGRTRAGAGTSSRPATATSRGSGAFRMLNTIGYDGPISVEWEDAGMDRLRGAPEALELRRDRLAFDPPASAFDSAFASDA